MKRAALVAMACVALGCAQSSLPHFAIRGLTLNTDETEYATDFNYRGSVVAAGDADASRPYLAVVSIRLAFGGGDVIKKEFPAMSYDVVPVVGGTGDFALTAGYRTKKTSFQEAETLEPAKFDINVVGAVPVTPLTETK